MSIYNVAVRTASTVTRYAAIAPSAHCAYMNAVAAQGDTPCGITVTPA